MGESPTSLLQGAFELRKDMKELLALFGKGEGPKELLDAVGELREDMKTLIKELQEMNKHTQAIVNLTDELGKTRQSLQNFIDLAKPLVGSSK